MNNPEGLPVNAVYGFLNMFLSLTANIKCDYCLVLFDAKRQNFRNEFFPDYNQYDCENHLVETAFSVGLTEELKAEAISMLL